MCFAGELLRWLNTAKWSSSEQMLGIDFIDTSFVACASIYFLRYWGQMTSSWLTVAISCERFLAVAFPLKASQISTLTKASCVCACTFIVCACASLFPFWTLTLHRDDSDGVQWCGYRDQQQFEVYNWTFIHIFSLLLPSFLIFVLTALIIHNLRRFSITRSQMSRHGDVTKQKGLSIEQQLTVMLVTVAIMFLVLRLPYMIVHMLVDFIEQIWGHGIMRRDPWFVYRLTYARDICDVIATSNFAINFFLYCLTGSQFRASVFACLKRSTGRRNEKSGFRQTAKMTSGATDVTHIVNKKSDEMELQSLMESKK